MSLLNSKVFSTFAGKASDFVNNLLDHAPVSTANVILNRGVTRIRAQESAVEAFMAPFSTFSELFSDRLATNYDGDIAHNPTEGLSALEECGALKGTHYSETVGNSILSYLGSSQTGNITVPIYNELSSCLLYWHEVETALEHYVNLEAVLVGGEVVTIFRLKYVSAGTVTIATTKYTPIRFKADSHDSFRVLYVPTLYVIWCLFNHIHSWTSYNTNNAVLKLMDTMLSLTPLEEVGYIHDSSVLSDINESLAEACNALGDFVSTTGYDKRFVITSPSGECFPLHLAYNNSGDGVLSAYWNHRWRYPFWIQTNYGLVTFPWAFSSSNKKTTITEILSSMTISSQINDFIATASTYANSTTEDAAGLAAALSNKTHVWHDSVKNLSAGAVSVLKKGGPHALATYLDGYFATGSSTSSDGPLLYFTDNSSWVPKNYLAGIIDAISEVVSVIGTVIAVTFSKILGVAMTCLGLLGKLFKSIFAAPYDDTKYTLNDSAAALPLSCNYATCKGVLERANIAEDLLTTLDSNSDIFAINVIGGYLLLGPAAYETVNGVTQITKWNWEFHPDLLDRSRAIRHLFYQRQNSIMRSAVVISDIDNPQKCKVSFVLNDVHSMPIVDITEIDEALAQYAPEILNPDSSGRTTNILHINNCVFGNTILFLMSMADYLFDITVNLDQSPITVRRIDTNTIGVQGAGVAAWMMHLYSLDPSSSYLPSPSRIAQCINSWGPSAVFLDVDSIHVVNYEQMNMTYGPSLLSDACTYLFDNLNKDNNPYFGPESISYLITEGRFSGQLITVTNGWEYYLLPPSYTLTSVIAVSVVGGVLAALAIAGTVYVATKVIPKIQAKRAQNAAKVEQAWTALTNDPSAENAKAYRKTVKKANFQSKIFGGSKFSKTNYWDSGGSAEEDTDSAKTISSLILGDDDTALDSSVSDISATENSIKQVDTARIEQLITGITPA